MSHLWQRALDFPVSVAIRTDLPCKQAICTFVHMYQTHLISRETHSSNTHAQWGVCLKMYVLLMCQ